MRAELAGFVADAFASVPRRDQRAKEGCCLRGLMLDGRRKSAQAMASRLTDGNEQNRQQLVNQSTWVPLPVRRRIAERMTAVIAPEAWVINDVSFPKGGRMSVGVIRQYCHALRLVRKFLSGLACGVVLGSSEAGLHLVESACRCSGCRCDDDLVKIENPVAVLELVGQAGPGDSQQGAMRVLVTALRRRSNAVRSRWRWSRLLVCGWR